MPSYSPHVLIKKNDADLAALQRVRQLTRLLDSAIGIPGTRWRLGLDPLLGLVPGVGDALGAAISIYIVVEAAHLGVPTATLGRMLFNILLDGAIGTIPLLGDWFDFGWKANTKNLALIETYFQRPQTVRQANRWFLLFLVLGFTIFTIGLIALLILLAQAFVSLLHF